jgi:fucose permease
MSAGVPHRLIACLCALFASLGLTIAALGPALPEFAMVAGLRVSEVGLLYSALFAGFLASQITASLLLDRRGTRVVILTSLVLFALGGFGLALATSLGTLLTASAVLGVGYGFGTISMNLVASRLMTHRPAFVVNLVNVLYGVGTVTGPLITSAVLRQGGQARVVPAVGGLLALVLLPWAWRELPDDSGHHLREAVPATSSRAIPLPLLLMGLLVFLYGGVEAGFSGWAATYLERTLGVTPARAAFLTSMYWLAYVGGRVVSTVLALRIGPAVVLEGALVLLAAGGAMLAVSVGHAAWTTAALLLLGGATGPIYPSMFGTVTQRFADRAAFAVSAVAAIGCLGAILLPWTMGLTLPLAGGRVLAATPVLLALGMWASYRWSSRVSV